MAKEPKKEMPRDKKLAKVGIMATIAVAIMIVGAQIAVSAPGVLWVLLIGWAFVLVGIGYLICTFVKFNKI
jgi:fatty acid desaturase